MARDVAEHLHAIGIDAVASGQGGHWRVTAGDMDGRVLVARAVWYEAGPPPSTYEGLELYVELDDERANIANGRTRSIDELLVAARHWLGGARLEDVIAAAPFVDAAKRASRALAAQLDRELGERITWHLGSAPSYELWIYDERRDANRLCRVMDGATTFYIGQVQVAFAAALPDARPAIQAWLGGDVRLAALVALGAELERHAEVLEIDPARWHWLHVGDRIADPDDVLAPLAPLLARLADSPIASRFYTYSSLATLCFSASSHFPWVGSYPSVVRAPDGTLRVGGEPQPDLASAVATIEAALAASPIAPFFGSAADHELPAVAAAFARANSHFVPRLIRRQQWSDVGVVHGARRAIFSETKVRCIEGDKQSLHDCTTLDAAVSIAIAFLGA